MENPSPGKLYRGWIQLWKFFRELFSASEDASIKRFSGFIILMFLLWVTYFASRGNIPEQTWKMLEDWIMLLAWLGTGLLGLGAAIDAAKILKDKFNQPPKQP